MIHGGGVLDYTIDFIPNNSDWFQYEVERERDGEGKKGSNKGEMKPKSISKSNLNFLHQKET